MKWLLEKGCFIGDSKIFVAAEYGSLFNMKWLLEITAIKNGNIQNLKWLFENGCRCNSVDKIFIDYIYGSIENLKRQLGIEIPFVNL